MTDHEILGMLEAGYSIMDVIEKSNKSRTEVLSLRSSYVYIKGSQDLNELLYVDKVEEAKAKHTTMHEYQAMDILPPVVKTTVADVEADLEVLKNRNQAAALRVVNAVSDCIYNEVTAAELDRLASVVVKINESFFKQSGDPLGGTGVMSMFEKTLKD